MGKQKTVLQFLEVSTTHLWSLRTGAPIQVIMFLASSKHKAQLSHQMTLEVTGAFQLPFKEKNTLLDPHGYRKELTAKGDRKGI